VSAGVASPERRRKRAASLNRFVGPFSTGSLLILAPMLDTVSLERELVVSDDELLPESLDSSDRIVRYPESKLAGTAS